MLGLSSIRDSSAEAQTSTKLCWIDDVQDCLCTEASCLILLILPATCILWHHVSPKADFAGSIQMVGLLPIVTVICFVDSMERRPV